MKSQLGEMYSCDCGMVRFVRFSKNSHTSKFLKCRWLSFIQVLICAGFLKNSTNPETDKPVLLIFSSTRMPE